MNRRYELASPRAKAEAKRLFLDGGGRISSLEVLRELVTLLGSCGVEVTFVRIAGEDKPVEIDLDTMRAALKSNFEVRPSEED